MLTLFPPGIRKFAREYAFGSVFSVAIFSTLAYNLLEDDDMKLSGALATASLFILNRLASGASAISMHLWKQALRANF